LRLIKARASHAALRAIKRTETSNGHAVHMSALLTDLYQLTMLQAHLEEDLQQSAVFELFVRKLPPQRRFGVAGCSRTGFSC